MSIHYVVNSVTFFQNKEPEYSKVRRKGGRLRDPHSESQGEAITFLFYELYVLHNILYLWKLIYRCLIHHFPMSVANLIKTYLTWLSFNLLIFSISRYRFLITTNFQLNPFNFFRIKLWLTTVPVYLWTVFLYFAATLVLYHVMYLLYCLQDSPKLAQ